MHKAELVWYRFEIDVSGLVTSQEEDMIFRLTLTSMGKNRQLFKKRLFHKVIPISLFLNSRKHKKICYIKCIHQKLVECANEIIKLYNNLQRFSKINNPM